MNTLNTTNQWNPWNWFRNDRMQSRQRGHMSRYFGSELSPFSYFAPFSHFYRDMDQIFEHAFGTLGMIPGSFMAEAIHPKINVAATDKEYLITVEAPGIHEKDLRLDILDEGVLRIRGERKQELADKTQDMQRVESSYGFFERVLPLPDDVEKEDVSATCENGLVMITLPRREQSRSQGRSISINAPGSGSRERYSGSSRASEQERGSEQGRTGSSANLQKKSAA